MSEPQIGIIVLAAGASTRMGTPKQLLQYQRETLLGRAVNPARGSLCRPLIVVLGAQAHALRADLTAVEAQVVINEAWREGLGSSIRCGLAALAAAVPGELEAAVLTLCDQPFVSAQVINRLLKTYQAARPLLVASAYEAKGEPTYGVPALFSRALFPELLSLRGAEGAKRVIARHRQAATFIAVPEAAFDVDTPADYHSLKAVNRES